ncbi:uncharacterized protein LOC121179304 [Toxotes jaculatrix]|uniref:uncharacterized protein LOC121179304 n=1 Tax=Toxotes jaculatrix TaxID=941984 RepID=UPI001B3A9A78|nr:uncharacterized protein LOC121179304 [Toxotes jaculatrix]
MDGVLEGAAVLCICKLTCSLFFLPSLTASYSPVSFCCCCLLIFTDFLVTVFLSFLCIFESWLTEPTTLSDVIALRFLLFLSHTYGAVLLLTTPLIAVETLTRRLWPRSVIAHRALSRTVDSEVTVEEREDGSTQDEDKGLSHVVGYLCCLSVWIVVALNVMWRWQLEEEWVAACFHTTNSLIRCLPSLFSPMPSIVNPCWGMAFLSLLLLLLTTSAGLHRRHRALVHVEGTHRVKCGVNGKSDSCWQDLVPAQSAPTKPVNPGMLVSEPPQCVDPEKTESSCTVHRAYSWNIVQMSARHHGDLVLVSPGCLSAERGEQEHERTMRGIALTFITEEHVDSQYGSQLVWQQSGFPCPGVNVMIGFVGVLSIFVLPLNLSVNILLIRTIETVLELCVRSLVSSAANRSDTSASHNETFV